VSRQHKAASFLPYQPEFEFAPNILWVGNIMALTSEKFFNLGEPFDPAQDMLCDPSTSLRACFARDVARGGGRSADRIRAQGLARFGDPGR
jgi:hypothetical protein